MITGTTEQLLARILQVITPCPEVCNNTDPYGTGTYDIRSGLRIPELREPPCYCYTMTTNSASTCSLEYVDCNGSVIEFSQTGTTQSVVNTMCIKNVNIYNCESGDGSLIKNGPCGQGNIC